MQELLKDPETIPFIHNSRVNLHCLKQEINRRVDKITAMLLGATMPNARQIGGKGVSFGCQTESQQTGEGFNAAGMRHRRVLSTHDSNIIDDGLPPCQERASLPYRKIKKPSRESSAQGSENHNIRTRVSDYLTSKKQKDFAYSNLIQRQPSEDSDQKLADFIRQSQEDKMFKSIEFQLQRSKETSQSCLGKSMSPHFTLPVTQQVSSQEVSESEDQLTQGRKSFSTVARRQLSTRKLKFTERTNLTQNQVRIVVSDECRLRIIAELSKSLGMKRKQPTDNKLRLNIIRKIQERYGDYYQNF